MPRGSEKYPLPISPGGVREDLNPLAIPDGDLLSSSNWLTRQGEGRPRPGYTQVGSAVAAGDRIIGIGFRGSADVAGNGVIHTLTAAYKNDASYTAITGTWAASTASQPVRFAALAKAGTTYIFRVNAANAVDYWDGSAGAFVSPSGTAPTGVDVTVTNARVVVFGAGGNPYRVQWCDFNDFDTWSATQLGELSGTEGSIVAGRALGPLSVAIYKDDSVWKGVAQAAKIPFQFQLVQPVPGPASPAAVVPYRGQHYWLGKDGVVYSFDGSTVRPFNDKGDHLAKTVRTTFEWSERLRTHGFVLGTPEPELWFIYPVDAAATMTGAICLNLTTGAMTPHTLAAEISASSTYLSQLSGLTIDGLTGTIDGLGALYPSIDGMGAATHPTAILGDTVGKVYTFGGASTDAGTAIPWEFVHGWKAPAGEGKRLYVDGVASYWSKAAEPLDITVGLTMTDSLSDDSVADAEQTDTFDVSTASNHLVTFPDTIGQWAKVRHAADSSASDLTHRGSALLGWARAMV